MSVCVCVPVCVCPCVCVCVYMLVCSVYAKYFFDLRSLAEENQLMLESEPLTRDRASKLEALSNATNRYEKGPLRRSSSDPKLKVPRAPPAVLP